MDETVNELQISLGKGERFLGRPLLFIEQTLIGFHYCFVGQSSNVSKDSRTNIHARTRASGLRSYKLISRSMKVD